MIKGSITALVTPFRDGKVDEQAFQDFIDWQIDSGTHCLVPCGTTGESPTLSDSEHRRVVALCVEAANGRVPVIAGAGSNETRVAIDYSKHAKEEGADAVVQEMKQLDYRGVIEPVKWEDLTREQKSRALRYRCTLSKRDAEELKLVDVLMAGSREFISRRMKLHPQLLVSRPCI